MAYSAVRFPKPDRSNKKKSKRSDFYWEIDTGRSEIVMDDGRPALIEEWFDCETRADCTTVFYSTLGIARWSKRQHQAYLTRNKIIKRTFGISVMLILDASVHSMWSVTSVRGFEEAHSSWSDAGKINHGLG